MSIFRSKNVGINSCQFVKFYQAMEQAGCAVVNEVNEVNLSFTEAMQNNLINDMT